jgi:tRNA threonylcarbamoyladenosine biosynthesis protein TsaE
VIFKRFELNFDQIDSLAQIISKNLGVTDIILLNGDLGTGKTFFVQKVCYFLNSKVKVLSPTFGIYNIYDFDEFKIWHYDLYRLEHEEIKGNLINIDLDEAISNNITFIEWAEKCNIEFTNSLSIKFFFSNDHYENKRILELKYDENSKWSDFLQFL